MTNRVSMSRRLAIVLTLLPVLLTGLLATPAAAATYDNEQQLKSLPHGTARETFILTGTPGQFLGHSDLRANSSYFIDLGYDMNFLTWAPVNNNYDPGGEEWSGCIGRPSGGRGICPADLVAYTPVRDLVRGGPLKVLEYGGSFISLVCGNHPRQGASGPQPTISGMKYEDVNGNGNRESGEPGLGNWTIRLAFNGSEVASAQTASDGSYSFALDANTMRGGDGQPIGAGTYTVTEDQQAGWASSAAPGQISVGFGSGAAHFGDRNFGNYRPATITGLKVEDMDADGVGAGDPGSTGWDIRLGGHDRPSSSTVTGAGGQFQFSNLRPGNYTVSEVQQEGWLQSAPDSGTFTVTVASGETRSGLNFGNYRLGSIAGRKFDDYGVDGGGEGDTGLPGWTISRSGGGNLVTSPGGAYKFSDLKPGVYTVNELQRDGWRQTAPATGSHEVRVRSGGHVNAIDFGNVCLGSVSILVGDITGRRTELGLEFLLEEIDVPGILDNDPALPQGGIDRSSFGTLLPGRYRVSAFLPDGVFTADPDARIVDGRWAIVKGVTVANCSQTELRLEVFTASVGKVTGGMRMPVPGGFATAGFQFQSKNEGTPQGMLEYQDHAEGLNLHTKLIEGIWVDEQLEDAWIWGRLTFKDETVRFRLHLVDAGEPGTEDRFELDLPGYSEGQGVELLKGNVQIHRTN